MKKLLILIVLVAVAVGGYLYFYHVRTTPEYSLMQAYKALDDHDVAAFEQYVDVNSVTNNLVNDVTQNSSALGLLNPGGLAMKGALSLLKPQLVQAARKEVQRYVETGSAEAAAAPRRLVNVSILGLAGKVVGEGSRFKGVQYTRQEGEQALVGLEFTQPRYDTTLVLEVKMRNQGDHWQATEITNTGAILQHVARMEKRRLVGGR
ncbi:hypothetical protein [Hymenobacter rubripertinctus]|uniref:DUF2939 domain-containing protein n=1 Tax=Hymenobacter rubripertinctus TaxID=2029981 RepID=A0A418QS80_9BACT|nr:hypothetical protein [Hymenobacter rubripertinctus]RIY07938.1 hypothetical protein D0T11_15305 [Hymenobacter rubripertinctus]